MPTAALLAAAIPGVAAGQSFELYIDPEISGAITLNGASAGVTYAGDCGSSAATGKTISVLINFTSATAYQALCSIG